MIKKEDFLKEFPIKVKGCVVDDPDILMTCAIDTEEPWDCVKSGDYKSKEDCPYWRDLPNWDYIERIWDWIEKYQTKNPT